VFFGGDFSVVLLGLALRLFFGDNFFRDDFCDRGDFFRDDFRDDFCDGFSDDFGNGADCCGTSGAVSNKFFS
jgi:hypothetical protein